MSLGVSETRASSGSGEMSAAIGPICLIVEDQVLIGLSLEAYLEEVGFGTCETFPTATEALA